MELIFIVRSCRLVPKKTITFLSKLHRLDGEHVVFGKVIDGMDTVYAIEGGAGTYSGKPRKKVIIVDSGEIPKSKWEEDNRVSTT